MNEFWTGAIWASGFWILVYCVAVFIWAFVDARNRGAEMMNTEAANDRPFTNLTRCPYCGAVRPNTPHRRDCVMITPTLQNFGG